LDCGHNKSHQLFSGGGHSQQYSLCTNRPILLQVGVYYFGICISDVRQGCNALLYKATGIC